MITHYAIFWSAKSDPAQCANMSKERDECLAHSQIGCQYVQDSEGERCEYTKWADYCTLQPKETCGMKDQGKCQWLEDHESVCGFATKEGDPWTNTCEGIKKEEECINHV